MALVDGVKGRHADVLVLGAGAAGLMCAITAARRGRRVVVLDRSNRVGKKILMSGGGKCNFTNLHCAPGRFLSANPHFCKSALARYTQWDFIDMVERHRIAYFEKETVTGLSGQLFCRGSSKEIVAMLMAECETAGVEVRTGVETAALEANGAFRADTDAGAIEAGAVVVATGGLSIPSLGGSAIGYRLAEQFGLPVLPTSAGLVPLTFTDAMHALCERLAGVSCEAVVRSLPEERGAGGDSGRSGGEGGDGMDRVGRDDMGTADPGRSDVASSAAGGGGKRRGSAAAREAGRGEPRETRDRAAAFREDLLFTHRGLSGPAILQVSSYWRPGEAIAIDLLPGEDATALLLGWKREHPKGLLRTRLARRLPEKLVHELEALHWPDMAATALAEWPDRRLEAAAGVLADWRLKPAATEGYRTAEVTLGGVDTRALSSKTMESPVPGLFFIGEVVDVTGHLGGFNFQWAWSSGYAAGQAV